MAKEKSKGMDKKELDRIEKLVKAVHDKNSLKQSKADRRDNLIHGALGLLYLALIVFAVIEGDLGSALFPIGMSIWLIVVWFQARHINFLNFVVNVNRDLRKVENDELLRTLKLAEEEASK